MLFNVVIAKIGQVLLFDIVQIILIWPRLNNVFCEIEPTIIDALQEVAYFIFTAQNMILFSDNFTVASNKNGCGFKPII